MFDYVEYAKQLRHELHQIPEIGFDLPKTLAVVRRELDAMGVSYTEKYGKSSIVATINEAAMSSQSIRFKITATYEGGEQTFDIPVTVVYTQIYAGDEIWSADKFNGGEMDEYICAVVIKDISATKYKDVDIKFTVQTCVVTEYGNLLTGEAYSWVVTNGKIQK